MSLGEAVVSVGASGAIFGIFGVMLVMIFKNRQRMGQVSAPRLIILFVLMVFGNMEEGVDVMAHLGGALIGVAMGFLLKTEADILICSRKNIWMLLTPELYMIKL